MYARVYNRDTLMFRSLYGIRIDVLMWFEVNYTCRNIIWLLFNKVCLNFLVCLNIDFSHSTRVMVCHFINSVCVMVDVWLWGVVSQSWWNTRSEFHQKWYRISCYYTVTSLWRWGWICSFQPRNCTVHQKLVKLARELVTLQKPHVNGIIEYALSY